MSAIKRLLVMTGLLLLALSQPTRASVVFSFAEIGGGVQMTATGTLDLTGLTGFSLGSAQALVGPSQGYVIVGNTSSSSNLTDVYRGLTGPSTFGTGGLTYANSAPGTLLGITNFGQWLYVSNGFGGGAINSSAYFASTTIAALGMNPGTHTWSWSNDFVSLVVPGPNVVPLPAALPLLGTGLALMSFVGWRRKRAAAA